MLWCPTVMSTVSARAGAAKARARVAASGMPVPRMIVTSRVRRNGSGLAHQVGRPKGGRRPRSARPDAAQRPAQVLANVGVRVVEVRLEVGLGGGVRDLAQRRRRLLAQVADLVVEQAGERLHFRPPPRPRPPTGARAPPGFRGLPTLPTVSAAVSRTCQSGSARAASIASAT